MAIGKLDNCHQQQKQKLHKKQPRKRKTTLYLHLYRECFQKTNKPAQRHEQMFIYVVLSSYSFSVSLPLSLCGFSFSLFPGIVFPLKRKNHFDLYLLNVDDDDAFVCLFACRSKYTCVFVVENKTHSLSVRMLGICKRVFRRRKAVYGFIQSEKQISITWFTSPNRVSIWIFYGYLIQNGFGICFPKIQLRQIHGPKRLYQMDFFKYLNVENFTCHDFHMYSYRYTFS
jgi:hypothetical protein